MKNKWPIIGEGNHEDQVWWHLTRNHYFCMGLQLPSSVSKAKRGKFFGKCAMTISETSVLKVH